ncbi:MULTISPECIES: hypothetical protein [Methylobacterium]|uniref:hypothetical protein n=1 Tax=Methylobacterium TaxID=407 RepID=UPI0013EA0A07|nr:hypothetical protein [Methylobacterium sp. DB0501]NGM34314.1 hypothetical protein [Methylobacterium sp. DB0501]
MAGLAVIGALSATPVAAEDFTGFYAGINAGYGWSKERTEGAAKPGVPLPAGGTPQGADGLPPSAARAADRNPAFSGARMGTQGAAR